MAEYRVVEMRAGGPPNTAERFLDAANSMIYDYGKAKIANIIECLVEKESDRCKAAKQMLRDVLVEMQRRLVQIYNVHHPDEQARIEFVDSVEE